MAVMAVISGLSAITGGEKFQKVQKSFSFPLRSLRRCVRMVFALAFVLPKKAETALSDGLERSFHAW